MFNDTKSVLAMILILAAVPAARAQAQFPFTVERDANGSLTRIELPVRQSIMDNDDDILGELKNSLREFQATKSVGISAVTAEAITPQTADDRKLYEAAKEVLKNDLSMNTLSDSRLEREYASAKAKILNVKLYRLLAAPTAKNAFDKERAIVEVVQNVIGEAGSVLGIASPALTVFTFLVDQYVDALQSRRDFYQNQLLVLLANDQTMFTEKEKSAVRSSVFYSRLDFIDFDLKQRDKARKAWATYGDDQLAKALKPCKGFAKAGETSFGACFKVNGDLYQNRMVKKSKLSGSVSLAFDASRPHRVRDFRALLMLARLGVDLVPGPGLAKKPFKMWIDSQYRKQRSSEGYFYGNALLKKQTSLGDDILMSSANPLIQH